MQLHSFEQLSASGQGPSVAGGDMQQIAGRHNFPRAVVGGTVWLLDWHFILQHSMNLTSC